MSPSEFDELEAELARAHGRRHRRELLWSVLICFAALVATLLLLGWLWITTLP